MFAFLGPAVDPQLREAYTTVTNEDIFKRILDEPEFRGAVLDHYAERIYGRLRADEDQLGLTVQP